MADEVMKRIGLVVAGAAMILVASCADGDEDPPSLDLETPTPTATAEATEEAPDDRPEMFGTKYAVAVQERIDAFAEAEDCDALQDEFDAAESNNTATIERTGSGTADLMEYIDDRMREAGCY